MMSTDHPLSASFDIHRERAPIDRFAELISIQAEKPSTLSELNFRALDPFQRVLLTIDGTVTKFIEAYMMDPVDIVLIGQELRRLPSDHFWLEAAKGTSVLAREVLLKGKYSRVLYTYATSLIVPERLGKSAAEALEAGREGLGRILLQNRLETFREILWCGKETTHLPAGRQGGTLGSEFISRTYRILAGGQPLMIINERFPADIDWIPRHH